jgi:ABC-type microcin C transport system permease subunit YejE
MIGRRDASSACSCMSVLYDASGVDDVIVSKLYVVHGDGEAYMLYTLMISNNNLKTFVQLLTSLKTYAHPLISEKVASNKQKLWRSTPNSPDSDSSPLDRQTSILSNCVSNDHIVVSIRSCF